jgi:hypothetical protein
MPWDESLRLALVPGSLTHGWDSELWELTVFDVFLLDRRCGQHFSEKCSSISIRLLSPSGATIGDQSGAANPHHR